LCVWNKAILDVQKGVFFNSFRGRSAAKKRPLEAETNPNIYKHVEDMKATVLLALLKGSICTPGRWFWVVA
jgi:hypothetical protein